MSSACYPPPPLLPLDHDAQGSQADQSPLSSHYRIQEQLLHSLHANSANWPTTVENHAIALLRSGEVTTFPALLRRVLEDVRRDTSLAPTTNGAEANGKKANGTPAPGADSNGNSSTPSLAVPQTVVDDALKVTRENLEMVCSMQENGAS